MSLNVNTVSEFYRWAQSTFGTGMRVQGCVNHIRSELEEVLEEPTDVTEWCDVMILALNGATRAAATHLPDDATPEDISQYVLNALEEKMNRNYRRTWARDENGLMSHINEG